MKLSVIVCTRNRAHAIIPCLDSIAASLTHVAPVDGEIVVVDNASEDNTASLLREWAGTCAFPVNVQFEPRKGATKARNHGVRAARGDLLVMTDDDCRLDKDYIGAALRHDAADTELVLRGGRVELGDPTDLPLTIKTEREPKRWHRRMNSARHENLGCCLLGCNITMRRALYERLGPFDELFGPGSSFFAAEETDYVFRAYRAGITIEYAPDMVIYHHHGRKKPADGYKLFRGYMISTGALFAKHFFKNPNLCRPFYWDIKNSIKETISNKNTFLPEVGFSHKNKVAYTLLGTTKYFMAMMKR